MPDYGIGQRGLFLADIHGRVVYACPSLVRIVGRDSTGQSCTRAVPYSDVFRLRRAAQRLIAGEIPQISTTTSLRLPCGAFDAAVLAYRVVIAQWPYMAVVACMMEKTP